MRNRKALVVLAVLSLVVASLFIVTAVFAEEEQNGYCPQGFLLVQADGHEDVDRNGDGYVCWAPVQVKTITVIDNVLPIDIGNFVPLG